ncbi:hypothetical protein PCASD_14505 [Puccinia coronata f. sp. avenae]|uniref:DUF6589 domain-containing protein n=1 Tax=Puccinia coronata f. sp. avenae TaxID=200324 RepID=A0A2N5TEW4_9BASI|nr:hypothetical protein PCASD_14505 [Puccinia coronata f. sp. avenae]
MPKHIILNPDDPPTIKTTDRNAIVKDCYQKFCTGTAQKEAKDQTCPKLYNTLMMLHDFSTVVEAKRSMKAGDVGRLMIVWSKWCLMTQALPGITNYSSYLPRMVLLLTIERLRDMFSSNIMMKLLHSLKTDYRAEIIYQSHKNKLSQRSLDMLIIMANNHDILDQYSKNTGKSKAPVDNTHQPPNDPDNANNENKSAADDESTNQSESSSGGSLDF